MLKIVGRRGRMLALAGTLVLAACSSTQQGAAQNANAAQIGAQVNAFANGIAGFNSGVAGVLAKINAGIEVGAQDFKMVCGAAGMAGGLFDSVAPLAGASSEDMANEKLAMLALGSACASSPTDLGTAVASALTSYQTVANAVNSVAPAAQVATVGN